ncbi:MAG: glycerophosphodiester phosphodiesterase family protein [Planktomarina sp.]
MKKATSLWGIGLAMVAATSAFANPIELGPRPLQLIETMNEGPLKEKLLSCASMDFQRTDFSIGHRGAPLQFPEHTLQSYQAAARMGAGIVECDVTFTNDLELVCRHSQSDLHTTTNILDTDLATKCSKGFTPASAGTKAGAACLTSDISLAEFRTLRGKKDAADKAATDVASYMVTQADSTLMTHAESIALFKRMGVKFTPELKSPRVAMPFNGFSQQDYAQKMIDEYKAAGIPAADVWVQSFNLEDVLYWINNEPEFGKQAVFLDSRFRSGIQPNNPATINPSMKQLRAQGVNYIAPPMWMLLSIEEDKMVPSAYAKAATNAGLKIITWTLERSGPLTSGGGWYYQSVAPMIETDGDMFEVLDVLATDVGIVGMFSDWAATTTYYANCMGL